MRKDYLSPKAVQLLSEAIEKENLEWTIANYIIHQPEAPEIDELISWLNLLKKEATVYAGN